MFTIEKCIKREKLRNEIEKKAKAKELKFLNKCRKGMEQAKKSKPKKFLYEKQIKLWHYKIRSIYKY